MQRNLKSVNTYLNSIKPVYVEISSLQDFIFIKQSNLISFKFIREIINEIYFQCDIVFDFDLDCITKVYVYRKNDFNFFYSLRDGQSMRS